jgi:NAD(P)-dependent dehydrogenase (short-subunit alcohol dehydrogenase family)
MTKAALVTGGSRGIGLGITKHLVADGFRVAVNGERDESLVAATLDELRRAGADVIYARGDVSDTAARASIMERTLDAFGRIDVLVNNAGITSPGRKDVLEATEESFERVIGVNLRGPFFLAQAAANQMIAQREREPDFRGTIVNITSINSIVATVNRGDYCLAKAALSMGTKLWATRLAEFDIDVFEIRPGIIATDMTKPVTAKYDKLIAEGLTLQKRWGQPDDIGSAVAALARGDIPYATGQVLTVDGGLTMLTL